MVVEVSPILSTVAQELQLTEADLLRQGARALLERQLVQLRAELFQIYGRYGVRSVEEMEGSLPGRHTRRGNFLARLPTAGSSGVQRDRLSKLLESLA